MAKTFINFAQGWDSKEKEGIATFSSDPERTTMGKDKAKFTLKLVNEEGLEMEVRNFFIKFLEKGRLSKNGKRLPEYQCTVVID